MKNPRVLCLGRTYSMTRFWNSKNAVDVAEAVAVFLYDKATIISIVGRGHRPLNYNRYVQSNDRIHNRIHLSHSQELALAHRFSSFRKAMSVAIDLAKQQNISMIVRFRI